MAISKEAWEEMEVLAAKLGVAELALKYKNYGNASYYMSKSELETRIVFLRQNIRNIYDIATGRTKIIK